MLTEGWDANTVTHILGIRAFGTQLLRNSAQNGLGRGRVVGAFVDGWGPRPAFAPLCVQVAGRALRRTNWALDERGHFFPEYAKVYGVPFSFIPAQGGGQTPPPPKPVTRVRALEGSADLEMKFPRLLGYRYDLPQEALTPRFTSDPWNVKNDIRAFLDNEAGERR